MSSSVSELYEASPEVTSNEGMLTAISFLLLGGLVTADVKLSLQATTLPAC